MNFIKVMWYLLVINNTPTCKTAGSKRLILMFNSNALSTLRKTIREYLKKIELMLLLTL